VKSIGTFVVATILLSELQLASVAAVESQTKIPRIGYVSGSGTADNPGPYVEALRQGLRDLGYVERKNFLIEYRGAQGKPDRIPKLIVDLVQSKVDVLVVPTSGGVRAASQATKTIPIVMVTQVDPVATGVVDSLARPGGNITGLTTLQRDLSGKRLELLMAVVPRLSRLGILRSPEDETAIGFENYEAAARALNVRLQSLDARGSDPDLEGAFREAVKGRSDAIATITNNPLLRNAKRVAALALKNQLPSMYAGATWVEAGGLMSYSANDIDLFRRAAAYVDRLLKGAKPADLPIEQPTKFEFVLNLKTARALNLPISQTVLFRADKVIK
jgi:putative tryptophan/tyrosine transport system substrate-binding protein